MVVQEISKILYPDRTVDAVEARPVGFVVKVCKKSVLVEVVAASELVYKCEIVLIYRPGWDFQSPDLNWSSSWSHQRVLRSAGGHRTPGDPCGE